MNKYDKILKALMDKVEFKPGTVYDIDYSSTIVMAYVYDGDVEYSFCYNERDKEFSLAGFKEVN